jgi:Arc/MetJ family transcription regulator
MGRLSDVKTTIEISDPLLAQARRHARRTGRTMRALVEEGLRMVLREEQQRPPYELADRAVGRKGAADPLESLSWQDLRDEIYGGR